MWLHNISGAQITLLNRPIADGGFLDIAPHIISYRGDDETVQKIADNDVRVSQDGVNDYSDSPAQNIALLMGAKTSIQELQNKTTTTNVPVVAIEPAEGSFESLVTHDLTSNYSSFTVSPAMGKVKRLDHAEVQFTSDIVWNEPIHFDVLIGQTVVDRTTYTNMGDLLSIANKGYELDGLPGFANKVFVLPFNYARPIDLKSSYGMSMRVSFEDQNANPSPMTGEFCTITFYTVEIDE